MKFLETLESQLNNDHLALKFLKNVLKLSLFRRNSEERKQGNLSFETAIQGTYRSQSHHDLNPSPNSNNPTSNIIWKTPSIEHIDRLRRLNKSQEHIKSALSSGGVALRSPNQKRAPRPAALFDADRLSFSSGEDEELYQVNGQIL